jgi:hypothetical protein
VGQEASIALAEKLGNREFIVHASRLHECEVKGTAPSICRLHTLSSVYAYKVTTEVVRGSGVLTVGRS